jgi:hypothetical protein
MTMTDTPRWRRYLRFFGQNIEADVQDEIRFHMESVSGIASRLG